MIKEDAGDAEGDDEVTQLDDKVVEGLGELDVSLLVMPAIFH